MVAVKFESFDRVTIDEINAGSFSDVVANYPELRVELGLACKTFHADLVAAHKTALDAKETALSEANSTILAKTQEINGLDGEIQAFESQVERLNDEKASLQTQVDTLTSGINTQYEIVRGLQGRLERLLNELPFNPREISVGAFKARLFSVLETEDVVRLYAAQPDSTLEQIAGTITNWDQAFPIRLDSEELLQPLGYLVSINLLTVAEVANLRRDCTRAEAFIAPI
jgi:hypothetical protein